MSTEMFINVTCVDGVECTMKKVSLSDIESIKENTRVCLMFDNNEEYFGFFHSVEDDEIMVKPFSEKTKKLVIGLPLNRLFAIFVEVDEQ